MQYRKQSLLGVKRLGNSSPSPATNRPGHFSLVLVWPTVTERVRHKNTDVRQPPEFKIHRNKKTLRWYQGIYAINQKSNWSIPFPILKKSKVEAENWAISLPSQLGQQTTLTDSAHNSGSNRPKEELQSIPLSPVHPCHEYVSALIGSTQSPVPLTPASTHCEPTKWPHVLWCCLISSP